MVWSAVARVSSQKLSLRRRSVIQGCNVARSAVAGLPAVYSLTPQLGYSNELANGEDDVLSRSADTQREMFLILYCTVLYCTVNYGHRQ